MWEEDFALGLIINNYLDIFKIYNLKANFHVVFFAFAGLSRVLDLEHILSPPPLIFDFFKKK